MTISKCEPTPTVYSWYTPQIAQVVSDLAQFAYPTEVFKQNYDPGLDDYHRDLMTAYLENSLGEVFTEQSVRHLPTTLPYSYYTNGSSEGLFHLLARHKTHFPDVPLYQFEGEYQGYNEYAKTLGIEFHTVPHGINPGVLRPGVFLISVPSAIDGNIVAGSAIEQVCAADHYVIIDTAYAGMAVYEEVQKLALHPHIAAVVGSMSKPFGLYYHRIGFLWSRDPVMSLHGNRWFKNVFSITVGLEVFKHWIAPELSEYYRPWQQRACAEASEHLGHPIQPSDVWLLGHVLPNAQDGLPYSLGPFKRGPGYRFCLTPYYMAYAEEAA